MKKKNFQYVIGMDGGGTKTVAALADLKGKILTQVETGSSNPLKVGMKIAMLNIKEVIKKILKKYQKEKIAVIYLALAAGIEKNEKKKLAIKRNLFKLLNLRRFSGQIIIDGDQPAAFRAGTDKKEGVVLISGTGSVAVGWKGMKTAGASGWDWFLGDDGSGFWLGRKALRAICRQLDGRGKKTLLSDLIFQKWNINRKEQLMEKVYYGYKENFVEQISLVSPLINKAARRGDKVAKEILNEGGKELALAVIQVVKKLNFSRRKFPLVLVGSALNSAIILKTVKKEVRKLFPQVEFIRPKQAPVTGAVKLALDKL